MEMIIENREVKMEKRNLSFALRRNSNNLNESTMIALTDLDVYKLGEKISDMVWDDYDHWPEKAQRTIGFQIIRSADSIAVNIAEGYGRFSPPDRRKFYRYSRGSFEETKAWLRKAVRRELVTAARTAEYDKIIQQLGPKLNAFINSTN